MRFAKDLTNHAAIDRSDTSGVFANPRQLVAMLKMSCDRQMKGEHIDRRPIGSRTDTPIHELSLPLPRFSALP
jgi:hypothetical protein